MFGWYGLLFSTLFGALVAGYAGYHFTAISYEHTIDQMKLDKADADLQTAKDTLKQFGGYVNQMNGAVGDYAALKYSLDASFGRIQNELAGISKAKPLPPDCFPTADRVRSLSAAIAAANNQAASTGTNAGAAMPASP